MTDTNRNESHLRIVHIMLNELISRGHLAVCLHMALGRPVDAEARHSRLLLCMAALSLAALLLTTGVANAQSGNGEPGAYLIPLVLTPYGFEPDAMNLRPNRVVLAVYNRTGLRELSLRIDREAPGRPRERIAQERVPSSRWKWRTQLALAPGTYLVSEENHPEWVCRITVTVN